MYKGGEMDSLRYLPSDEGSVDVSRLNLCGGDEGVLSSELWGSKGVGIYMVGSDGK